MEDKKIGVLVVGMSRMYGGTEAFIMTLFRNIDRSKYHFIFLNAYDESIACSEEITKLGGEIISLRLRRREDGMKKYKRGISSFFSNNKSKIDIVLQNVQDLINIDMCKYAHKFRIKTILWGHACKYGVKPRLLTRLSAIYNKLTYKKYIDLCVANSSMTGNWIFGKNNYQIVENFIDVDKFLFNQSARTEIRNKYDIKDDTKVFGTIGRLSIEKNQSFLLDIFQKINIKDKNTKLIIVGGGYLLDSLKEKANGLNIGGDVIFTGETNEAYKYYSVFDYFTFPSKFEGFGISLLEAECSNLPCFVSDVIPNETIKSNNVVKISLSKSSDYWADTILSNPLNNDRNSKMIPDIIRQSNSVESQIIKIEGLINKLYE